MRSTPETISQAQRALARYMDAERQQREHRAQFVPVDAGARFSVEDEAQHVPDSPTQRAAEYAKARNHNLRPLRQIDEKDENAREGRDSAIAYLERRRRSAVRK